MAQNRLANLRRGWEIAQPYVRQVRPLWEIGRRIIGSEFLPIALGVYDNLSSGNSYSKNYLKLFNSDTVYDASDVSASEPPAKRQKTGGAVPLSTNSAASDAIQSPHDSRNQAGSHSDIEMVRRMGSRRFRKRSAPGTAYRRIFRSWTGLSRLRRRGYRKPELKSIDGIAGSAPVVLFQNTFLDGVNAILLNAASQGTAYNQRIGNSILIKSMLVRACIEVPDAEVASTSFSQCVRIMIIKDRQANGLAPAITDIFETVNSTSGNVVTYAMNLTYRQRFKVLCDRRYVLSGASNAAEFFFEYISKRNHRVEYNGTSATPSISEIRTNAIWLVCLGPYAPGGTIANRPHLNSLTFRTRFIDP